MAKLLLVLVLLLSPAARPGADENSLLPIGAIDLNADMLLNRPALAAADTLVLLVEANREAYYKLSERGEILASGKLLQGRNSLLFARPGLFSESQSLFFILDLLDNGASFQKKINITVTVDRKSQGEQLERAPLSGSFTLGMYHNGRLIGFRKKNMTELLNLKTGLVLPVKDPGITGSAIRNQPASQGVSLLGLGMALAKFLAAKKSLANSKAYIQKLQKKKLTLAFQRQEKSGAKVDVQAEIELRVE
ncbi:MAG: hypothetical protein MUP71_12110 [Candidatus Aminicenantes bacterium]|nr:hypothetical protein [Candidatus Aminicenantes bacterium]